MTNYRFGIGLIQLGLIETHSQNTSPFNNRLSV